MNANHSVVSLQLTGDDRRNEFQIDWDRARRTGIAEALPCHCRMANQGFQSPPAPSRSLP